MDNTTLTKLLEKYNSSISVRENNEHGRENMPVPNDNDRKVVFASKLLLYTMICLSLAVTVLLLAVFKYGG